ncbi:hypothetical protein [Jatrophihabitans sp.]|uniref:hypothetical protein n=1 Tax=Jatrophihabitans sp. TaxID=1932789 RepID=UPI002BCF8344|nr:hypothetical protein [Jatrophihabitans sp.]
MTAGYPGLLALLGGLGAPCSLPARHAERLRRGRAGAAHDAGAGLWPEAGWRARAAERMASAPGCVALVLIDPVPPQHEAAIARCLLGVLRPSDPVGRYGTRQLAALVQVDLPAVGVLVAERVRARLAQAGIGCVLGVAVSAGEDLGDLLIRAGSDLMARRESAGSSVRW